MRAMFVVATAVAMLTAASGTQAQESFFNKRYCLTAFGKESGPDCSFNTWEQCRASVYGGHYCYQNPLWRSQPPLQKERPRRR